MKNRAKILAITILLTGLFGFNFVAALTVSVDPINAF